jgi:hypothetical protein
MIVVEASHAHVMKFLPPHCELSVFVSVNVIFCGDEDFIFFF